MAETDILNADLTWQTDLQDAIGPDYGWDQLRRSQLAWATPAFGDGWARTIGDKGPTTSFSWLNRSQRCVERIVQWAEQFEDDFFTIIDYASGRHYVGRFMGDAHAVEAGNDKWNLQGLQFQVVPGKPMVEYPSEWERWAITQRPFDGNGDLRFACVAAAPNVWQKPPADGTRPNQLLLQDAVAGDSLTYEYRGYGFRLWCGQGVAYGQASLWIDGMQTQLLNFQTNTDDAVQKAYENAQMPLGIHRVQLISDGTIPAGQAHNSILVDRFEVMR